MINDMLEMDDIETKDDKPKPDAFNDDHQMRDFAALSGDRRKPVPVTKFNIVTIARGLWNAKINFPYAKESADTYSSETYRRLTANSENYANEDEDSEASDLAMLSGLLLLGATMAFSDGCKPIDNSTEGIKRKTAKVREVPKVGMENAVTLVDALQKHPALYAGGIERERFVKEIAKCKVPGESKFYTRIKPGTSTFYFADKSNINVEMNFVLRNDSAKKYMSHCLRHFIEDVTLLDAPRDLRPSIKDIWHPNRYNRWTKANVPAKVMHAAKFPFSMLGTMRQVLFDRERGTSDVTETPLLVVPGVDSYEHMKKWEIPLEIKYIE